MTIAVHVRIDISRNGAGEIQGVLPPEGEKDGLQHEYSDDDAVPQEFVRDHGLHEHGEQRERQHLRQRDQEQFLQVLKHFVVVVAVDGLHQHADQHGNGEQNDFDDGDGRELGQPIDGLRQRQCVMDSVEAGVTLAPDQFGGVQGGDDDEEQSRRALHCLQHQVSDRPHVVSAHPSGKVPVIDGKCDEQSDDGPERDFARHCADAQAGQ